MIKIVVRDSSTYAQDIVYQLYLYAQQSEKSYNMDIRMNYNVKGEKVLKVKTNIPYNEIFTVVNKVSEGPFDELKTFKRCLF